MTKQEFITFSKKKLERIRKLKLNIEKVQEEIKYAFKETSNFTTDKFGNTIKEEDFVKCKNQILKVFELSYDVENDLQNLACLKCKRSLFNKIIVTKYTIFISVKPKEIVKLTI